MSAACRIGYVKRPTVDRSAPSRADLSLNCVMRPASPKPVMHCSTQVSWEYSATWLCTKSTERAGSIPAARNWAAVTRVRRDHFDTGIARLERDAEDPQRTVLVISD